MHVLIRPVSANGAGEMKSGGPLFFPPLSDNVPKIARTRLTVELVDGMAFVFVTRQHIQYKPEALVVI